MQRITDPTASATLPATPSLTGTTGYFTEGSPGLAPSTDVRAWFLNMLQEEMCNIVTGAGLTFDTTGTVFNQLLNAIPLLLFSGVHDVTSSRALATVYTNSTGKPMLVTAITETISTFSNSFIMVNGAWIFKQGQPNTGTENSVVAMVPPGGTYEINNDGGGGATLQYVQECH